MKKYTIILLLVVFFINPINVFAASNLTCEEKLEIAYSQIFGTDSKVSDSSSSSNNSKDDEIRTNNISSKKEATKSKNETTKPVASKSEVTNNQKTNESNDSTKVSEEVTSTVAVSQTPVTGQKYSPISDEDRDRILEVLIHEMGYTSSFEAYTAEATVVLERVRLGCFGGSSVLAVLTAPGQFTGVDSNGHFLPKTLVALKNYDQAYLNSIGIYFSYDETMSFLAKLNSAIDEALMNGSNYYKEYFGTNVEPVYALANWAYKAPSGALYVVINGQVFTNKI